MINKRPVHFRITKRTAADDTKLSLHIIVYGLFKYNYSANNYCTNTLIPKSEYHKNCLGRSSTERLSYIIKHGTTVFKVLGKRGRRALTTKGNAINILNK